MEKIKEGHFLLSFLPPIFHFFFNKSYNDQERSFNQEVIYGIMFDMTSEIIIGFKSQLRNVILAVVDRLQFFQNTYLKLSLWSPAPRHSCRKYLSRSRQTDWRLFSWV